MLSSSFQRLKALVGMCFGVFEVFYFVLLCTCALLRGFGEWVVYVLHVFFMMGKTLLKRYSSVSKKDLSFH